MHYDRHRGKKHEKSHVDNKKAHIRINLVIMQNLQLQFIITITTNHHYI